MADCPCGSGEERYPLYDARGIFCCYTCPKCVAEKKSKYRPEVFDDPGYEADEDIEGEYDDEPSYEEWGD